MAAILFLAETIFFIFEKVANPTSDSYSETPIAYKKMIRFDLYFKMAAVGAPGPHGFSFV